MKQTIFKASKSLGNFFSGYIILVYLTLMAMMSLLRLKNVLSIPEGFVSLLDKAEVYTHKYFFLVIGVSVVFLLISMLLSNTKNHIKGTSVVVLIVYACTMKSIYDFCVSFLTDKLNSLEFISSPLIVYISYMIVFGFLELIKRIFNLGYLSVQVNIAYQKIDNLIDKYLHEEDTFNMALCDNLIKKYGGNVNE